MELEHGTAVISCWSGDTCSLTIAVSLHRIPYYCSFQAMVIIILFRTF